MEKILYTIDGCHNCAKARDYLNQKGVHFKEINLFHNQDAAKKIKEIIGEVYTPVFMDGDKVLVGIEILMY